MSGYAVGLGDIRAAAERIRGAVHRTPVLTCASLDERVGMRVFLKCENFQRSGSFKLRGATNAIASLPGASLADGVVAHSSGNHGQALALAAHRRGVRCRIVMPRDASEVKRRAVEGYGAQIFPCEPTLEAREEGVRRILEEGDAHEVHPFDDPHVIAGQGTAALELLEEVPDLDAIVAPVGGGGLFAGTCLAARALQPRIRLFAAEPRGADDAARSLEAGERLPLLEARTQADGLCTSLGTLTWPVLRDHAEAVWTVGEEEITDAMRFVWERAKIVIESSAAVAIAALSEADRSARPRPTQVGVILSGGNLDLGRLPWTDAARATSA